MTTLTDRIAELERERRTAREQIHDLVAKVAGLDAQIDALRSGLSLSRATSKCSSVTAISRPESDPCH